MREGKVVVIQFVTLDGVVEGPERWAFRSGPQRMVADDFRLGPILDTGPKVVVSRSTPVLDAWDNSSLLAGVLVTGVAELARDRDVVVVGSTSVVHALAAADAVDEYRLLVIPTALGTGRRLFAAPVDLHLTSIETVGEAVLACYART